MLMACANTGIKGQRPSPGTRCTEMTGVLTWATASSDSLLGKTFSVFAESSVFNSTA